MIPEKFKDLSDDERRDCLLWLADRLNVFPKTMAADVFGVSVETIKADWAVIETEKRRALPGE